MPAIHMVIWKCVTMLRQENAAPGSNFRTATSRGLSHVSHFTFSTYRYVRTMLTRPRTHRRRLRSSTLYRSSSLSRLNHDINSSNTLRHSHNNSDRDLDVNSRPSTRLHDAKFFRDQLHDNDNNSLDDHDNNPSHHSHGHNNDNFLRSLRHKQRPRSPAPERQLPQLRISQRRLRKRPNPDRHFGLRLLRGLPADGRLSAV